MIDRETYINFYGRLPERHRSSVNIDATLRFFKKIVHKKNVIWNCIRCISVNSIKYSAMTNVVDMEFENDFMLPDRTEYDRVEYMELPADEELKKRVLLATVFGPVVSDGPSEQTVDLSIDAYTFKVTLNNPEFKKVTNKEYKITVSYWVEHYPGFDNWSR